MLKFLKKLFSRNAEDGASAEADIWLRAVELDGRLLADVPPEAMSLKLCAAALEAHPVFATEALPDALLVPGGLEPKPELPPEFTETPGGKKLLQGAVLVRKGVLQPRPEDLQEPVGSPSP